MFVFPLTENCLAHLRQREIARDSRPLDRCGVSPNFLLAFLAAFRPPPTPQSDSTTIEVRRVLLLALVCQTADKLAGPAQLKSLAAAAPPPPSGPVNCSSRPSAPIGSSRRQRNDRRVIGIIGSRRAERDETRSASEPR